MVSQKRMKHAGIISIEAERKLETQKKDKENG